MGLGRKENQKMKPYLVYQYLLRNTDENHFVSAEEIVGFLQETCGIDAEQLVNIMKEFVSDYQSEYIRSDAIVPNRIRTLNKSTIATLIYHPRVI